MLTATCTAGMSWATSENLLRSERRKFEAGRRDHAGPAWREGHESKAYFCRDRCRPDSRRNSDRHLDADERRRLRTVECPGAEVSIRSDVSAAAPRKVGDRRDRRDGRR